MFIVLSPTNPDPMYKQVTDQVKDAIGAGDLQANQKLPSIREMAQALNISVITIKRAYLDLETEGLILTRAGLGSFVADIDHETLRTEKLAEIRAELSRLLGTGKKFGITARDVIQLVNQIEEN